MRVGLGVRPQLFGAIFTQQPELGFFEAHSENYFGESSARSKLLALRQHYPISLHGVGLSLGRADHLDARHLAELRQLVDAVEPFLVSEHLAWSAYSHRHLPDLLPLPLTEQSLAIMCQHVAQLQDVLQRQVLIENPSNYLLFDQLQIPEPEFLNTLATRTGCGLLIDINNIQVSAANLGRDAEGYLDQLDGSLIFQYHLAGYTEVERSGNNVLIDTHNKTVQPRVWRLFEHAVKRHGVRPTLLEWDSDFPEFSLLLEECDKANRIIETAAATCVEYPKRPSVRHVRPDKPTPSNQPLADLQALFLDDLLVLQDASAAAIEAHRHRLWVYQNNVFAALGEYLRDVFPATCGVVGERFFKQMSQLFAQKYPPSVGNIHRYGVEFNRVIVEFEGLAHLRYLDDLISYEWALHRAYFADLSDTVDAAKVDAAKVDPIKVDQAKLLSMTVRYNPSVKLLNSEFPILEIHRQSLPEYQGEVGVDLRQSQDSLLVYKHGKEVMTRLLTQDQALFLSALSNCNNLLQAIEALQGSMSSESMSAAVAMIFELSLLSGFDAEVDSQDRRATPPPSN